MKNKTFVIVTVFALVMCSGCATPKWVKRAYVNTYDLVTGTEEAHEDNNVLQ